MTKRMAPGWLEYARFQPRFFERSWKGTLLTSWNYSDSRQDSGILEKIFYLDNNVPQRFPVSNYEHEQNEKGVKTAFSSWHTRFI